MTVNLEATLLNLQNILKNVQFLKLSLFFFFNNFKYFFVSHWVRDKNKIMQNFGRPVVPVPATPVILHKLSSTSFC